jgi:serine/threonine protein kinase
MVYASETLFHFNLMRDERTVLRLLEHRPHPNIVEAIDIDRPEGIYLRKYLQLSQLDPPTQPARILWYQDIIRALQHIHDLGIAHSDVRMDNVLFDHRGHAWLCDFSASSPFGHPNPALPHPDLPVPINGLSEAVSDATDRFAVASLIFQMELGTKPEFSVDDDGALVLPQVQTGLNRLDTMIQEAWLGKYNSTALMLKDADSLTSNISRDISGKNPRSLSRESFQECIRQWRDHRERKFGISSLIYPSRLILFWRIYRLRSPSLANRRAIDGFSKEV